MQKKSFQSFIRGIIMLCFYGTMLVYDFCDHAPYQYDSAFP